MSATLSAQFTRTAKSKKKFYAVHVGSKPGVYESWPEASAAKEGVKRPVFKGFETRQEAEVFYKHGYNPPGQTASKASKITKPEPNKKGKYYAVNRGHTPGVYNTWAECQQQTKGFSGAKFKSFVSFGDALEYAGTGGASPAVEVARFTEKSMQELLSDNERDDGERFVTVFTDGSARGNGKKGAFGGVGVYFGPEDPRNVAEPLTGPEHTNNRAELTAVVRALERAYQDLFKVKIVTDSSYSISCLTDWYQNWQNKKTPYQGVKNNDLIIEARRLIEMLDDVFGGVGEGVKFQHCRGHQGIFGNEMADNLANIGADMAKKLQQN